jgi:hypothetical protein
MGNEIQQIKEIWYRRKDETAKAFEAFCLYRDFGSDRSVAKVLRDGNNKDSLMSLWCRWRMKYDWVKRCQAYDTHLDMIRQKEREKDFAEREKKHLTITAKIMGIIEKKQESFDPEELSQNNLMDWLKEGIAIERTGFGKDGDEAKLPQLEINFVEEFQGI